MDFLSVSQPKRTGKTTGGLKLAQMMGGRDPDGSIFGVGKAKDLLSDFMVAYCKALKQKARTTDS